MRIAVRAENLKDIIADIEYLNIECSAAKVEDGDLFVLFLLKPIGK